jgi:hypothetical protein
MPLGKRWGCFYREELTEQLLSSKRRPGNVREGAFYLEPPFVELTLADGLWEYVNGRLGTLFDYAEDERVPPDLAGHLAGVLLEFARDRYEERAGIIRRKIGTTVSNGREPVYAEMSATALNAILNDLSKFLSVEATAGHELVFVM